MINFRILKYIKKLEGSLNKQSGLSDKVIEKNQELISQNKNIIESNEAVITEIKNSNTITNTNTSSTKTNTKLTVASIIITLLILLLPSVNSSDSKKLPVFENHPDSLEVLVLDLPIIGQQDQKFLAKNIRSKIESYRQRGLPIKSINLHNVDIDINETNKILNETNADLLIHGHAFIDPNTGNWTIDFKHTLNESHFPYFQKPNCTLTNSTINLTYEELTSNDMLIGDVSFENWLIAIHNFSISKFAAAKSFIDIIGNEELDCATNRDSAEMLVQRGNAYLTLRDYENAERCYLESLNIYPFFERGHANLACSFYHQDDILKSLDQYNKLLKDSPLNDSYLGMRSRVFLKLGEFDLAISDARKAININPDKPFNHRVLAENLLKQGFVNQGFTSIEKAIELDPNDSESYILYGNFFYDTDEYIKAKHYYSLAIKYGTTNTLAFRFVMRRDKSFSLAGHTELIRMNPDKNVYYKERAKYYKKNNNLENAFHDLEKALELDNSDAETYKLLSEIYKERGSDEKAIELKLVAEKLILAQKV